MRKFELIISQAEDGTWGFTCEGRIYVPDDFGDLALDPLAKVEQCFSSTGWPSEEIATERAEQHAQEHANTKAVQALRARQDSAESDEEKRAIHKEISALLMEPQKAFERRVLD